MSDMIQGPPKTVQQAQGLRPVRATKLNEERADEDRHLAELEERMRNARRRKSRQHRERSGESSQGRGAAEESAPSQRPSGAEKPKSSKDSHIDFTA